jgi:hypothetical protein
MSRSLTLHVRPDRLAIVQLDAYAAPPEWIPDKGLTSITWTEDETSIVCPEDAVPEEMSIVSRRWRALEVEGPLDLEQVGVLADLAQPLAAAGISIYVLSTYNTDYLLVRDYELDKAVAVLGEAGHNVKH